MIGSDYLDGRPVRRRATGTYVLGGTLSRAFRAIRAMVVAAPALVPRRIGAAVATGLAATVLAGCGLSTFTSGLGGGMFGGSNSSQTQAAGVSEEQLLAAAKLEPGQTAGEGEISHGCPRFNIWPRDNNVTVYEAGRVGDALAVVHRGEIMRTARECSVQPGRVTIKYGFSGRVLMGPKGRAGSIALPVTVFVTDAKRERLTTEKLRVDTEISMDRPIGYFSLVRTVTFTIPVGTRPGEFELFVGFERTIPNSG